MPGPRLARFLIGLFGPMALGLFFSPSSSASPPPVPVIIEAFTSEGCSSCPPADAFLAELDRAQPVDRVEVLAMEEHVGYWDSLGWRDPFGRPEHEGRQRTYARVLDDGSVYTPEIVVDGRHIARASSPEQAKLWLTDAAKGPRARLRVSRTTGGYVTIEVTDLPTVDSGDIAELWLALTESKLVSHVERGENAGRVLAHAPVVRLLRRVGTMSDRSMRTTVKVDVDPTWNPANLRAVAFVQLSRARTILGAAAR